MEDKKTLVRITTVPISLEKLLAGQLRYMSQFYRVIAVSSEKDNLERLGQKEKVTTFHVHLTRKITPIADFKALLRLYFYFRKTKPAIVHTHTPKAGTIGMLAAKLAGVSLEDFKALNPAMSRPVILAAGTPQILLPWDNAKVFQRNLEARSEGQYASWTVWSAPSTMSVAEAARRTDMSESDLRSLNNIPPRMLIKAGSALIVPRSATTRQDVSSHLADNGQVALAPEIVTRRTSVRAAKGETVASIAQRYKVSAANVADWNDVKLSAAFKAGQQVVMYLPVRQIAAAAQPRVQARSSASKTASAPTRRGGTPSKVRRR